MSEATRKAVEEALKAHVEDEYEDPWFITHWYAIVASTNDTMDATRYLHVSPIAPFHLSLGLIHIAEWRLKDIMEDDS